MVERLFDFYERWRAASFDALREDVGTQGDGLPIPPANFLMHVASSPEPAVYLKGGRQAAAAIGEILARDGARVTGAVLDFGCGCGRVMRWWRDGDGLELHGTDYNAELALWSRNNLPFARTTVHGLQPPAPYRDEKFDVIYALGVLSHLTEAGQRRWTRDFHRMLKPEGRLVVSTLGESCVQSLSIEERRRFANGELIVRNARSSGSQLCEVFHPPDYFRRELAGGFRVAVHEPAGGGGNFDGDLWLLRRLAG